MALRHGFLSMFTCSRHTWKRFDEVEYDNNNKGTISNVPLHSKPLQGRAQPNI